MNCIEAHPLIGPYLDGELNEPQAAPLRRHLLACVGCRTGLQSHKNLQRWFVQPEAVQVPRGFAAKVAQAAFAGQEQRAAPVRVVDEERPLTPAVPAGDGRVLRFVLGLTSAAAAATILVVLATRDNRLPEGAGLHASERPRVGMDEALQRLEVLQRAEAAQAAN